LVEDLKDKMNNLNATKRTYGFLWLRPKRKSLPPRWHFADMQEIIPEPIVTGKLGIDIGSGCGYDTYFMAKNNPLVNIFSLDISDGVYTTKEVTSGLKNVRIIRGSALNIPIHDNVFNFAYSYGVLHHTTDPQGGLKEIVRVLKKGAPVFLYLYEDHSDNWLKYFIISIIKMLRQVTVRIPPKILYIITFLASPFVVLLFSYPARFLKSFRKTQGLAEKIPFNFGTSLSSVTGDLFDRFSTPIEHRFNRDEVYNLLHNAGFVDVDVKKFRTKAGWVAWGRKADVNR